MIDLAHINDIPAILKLEKESFNKHNYHYLDLLLFTLLPNYTIIIAKTNKDIVGFQIIKFEYHKAHGLLLAVSKKYRHQHIGTELLNEMSLIAKNKYCDYVYFEVRKTNTAQFLYKKIGYYICKEINNMYKNPSENGLIMRLDLIK